MNNGINRMGTTARPWVLIALLTVSMLAAGCKSKEADPADTASNEQEVEKDTAGSEPQQADTKTASLEDVASDASAAIPTEVAAPTLPTLEIPHTSFVLQNGLTVIVHEDHKAPIVAVNMWYHVGSKNEPEGITGFAHLFEHLMFQGTENYKGEYFEPFEKVGATDMNGTTNEDRTNYFQNVPTPALDMALWMESDRMGHFMGAITQELLDEQRGVVQNEKRQGLNQPYGEVWEIAGEFTYPKNHPYAHSVIGSMDDLNAATLEDVKKWFETWYGPSNAVLVLAGDITPEEARAKAEKYFGDIAPGPELERPDVWVSPMKTATRYDMKDEVPQTRIHKIWNVPEWGHPAERHMDLTTNILAVGKNSRLYKRLVYDDELATSVNAWIGSGEIGSQVWLIATARPGVDPKALEAALDDEMNKFRTDGVTEAELARAKMQHFSGSVYGAERVGGFGGKSDLLARSQVLGGDPDAWKKGDDIVRNATVEEMNTSIQTWLGDGVFTLVVHPEEGFDPEGLAIDTPRRSAAFEEGGPETPPMRKDTRQEALVAKAEGADRSALPDTGTPPGLVLPTLERFKLENGLEVVLAERNDAPVVRATMQIRAGYAADQLGKVGTANMAMSMLDEGTTTMDALTISGQLEDLGASISAGSVLDMSVVKLGTLKATLPQSLALFADVILNPAFPAEELERLRKRQLAAIQQEKSQPVQTALRLLGPIMFGEGHAYGVPLTGSGTEASVASMTRDELVAFHTSWFRPDLATLVVVGDISRADLEPQLNAAFSQWKAPDTPAPVKTLDKVSNPESTKLYLVHKPNAEQSVIIGGLIAPPRSESDIPLKLMNGVLGGQFTSRLNMNLREDKHWSYGSYSFVVSSQNQRLMAFYAAVQTDKTAESLAELGKELVAFTTDRPATEPELKRLQDNYTLKLPGENETTSELLRNIEEIVEYKLADDYWQKYVGEVRGTPLTAIDEAAKAVVMPGQVAWIVVGDLEKIQKPIEKLKYAEIEVLTLDAPESEDAKPKDANPEDAKPEEAKPEDAKPEDTKVEE